MVITNIEIGYLLGKGEKERVLKDLDINLGYSIADGDLQKILSFDLKNTEKRLITILKDQKITNGQDRELVDQIQKINIFPLPPQHKTLILHLKQQLLGCIRKKIDIETLSKLVTNYLGLHLEALERKTRKREIVRPRQYIMFFARGMSLGGQESVGEKVGHKDHATVIHAQKTINNLLEAKDKETVNQIQDIIRILNSQGFFDINFFNEEKKFNTRKNIETIIQPPFKF